MSWGCGGGDGRPLRASQALHCPGRPRARRGDKVSGALDIVSWLARKSSKAAEEAGPGPGSVNAPLNKEKLDKEKAEAILMPCASIAGQPCRCLTRAAFLCPLERPARGQRVPTPRAGLAATHCKTQQQPVTSPSVSLLGGQSPPCRRPQGHFVFKHHLCLQMPS